LTFFSQEIKSLENLFEKNQHYGPLNQRLLKLENDQRGLIYKKIYSKELRSYLFIELSIELKNRKKKSPKDLENDCKKWGF
jgi:hypothetical protein